jgi:hypothetical protein
VSDYRRRRGDQSNGFVAAYVRTWWPGAKGVEKFTPGSDILNTPGVVWEVKSVADEDFRWGAVLRRVAGYELVNGAVGLCPVRGRGCGPANVGDWPTLMPLSLAAPITHHWQTCTAVPHKRKD